MLQDALSSTSKRNRRFDPIRYRNKKKNWTVGVEDVSVLLCLCAFYVFSSFTLC